MTKIPTPKPGESLPEDADLQKSLPGDVETGTAETGTAETGLPESHARAGALPPAQLPQLGLRGWLRFIWRQLTSMQTALFLLMLLAIGALPGSYFPQRNQDPSKTAQYLESHGEWAKWLDKVGFFDVYSSPWFSAIYLLLFASLVGCVIPRGIHHYRAIKTRPPVTPVRLSRFANYRRWDLNASDISSAGGFEADAFNADIFAALKKRRYRVDVHETSGPQGTEYSVAAERGYLRETGNLIFHLALVGVLCAVAFGYMFSYKGQVIVVEGEGFSNNIANYDSFSPGPLVDTANLPNFQFQLNKLHVSYEELDRNKLGEPRDFNADLTVRAPGEPAVNQNVLVNSPLRINGTNAYLLGNGYALDVTYKDGSGHVFDTQQVTVPVDGNYTSNYVSKLPDAAPLSIAFTGIFMPTGSLKSMPPRSEYPDLLRPLLLLTGHTGDLSVDAGQPSNVYLVDTTKLKSITTADGDIARYALAPGQTVQLPNGLGSITFNGAKRYAAFDIKYDPATTVALVFMFTSIAGLITSIFVPRRRVWFKTVSDGNGGFIIEGAALARSEDPSLETALDELADAMGLGVGSAGLAPQTHNSDNKQDQTEPAVPASIDERDDDGTAKEK